MGLLPIHWTHENTNILRMDLGLGYIYSILHLFCAIVNTFNADYLKPKRYGYFIL